MISCLDGALTSGKQPSPFEKLVALDIYDGPVNGIAFCTDTQQPVVFRMLAWDEQQAVRIFELCAISQEEADSLVDLLSRFEEPRWPEWWVRRSMVGEDDSVRQAVSHLLTLTERAIWYVAMTDDLLGGFQALKKVQTREEAATFRVLRRRQPQGAEVADGTFQQWLQFMNQTPEES